MTRNRRVLACISALALTALLSSSVTLSSYAADPASETAAAAAAAWLTTQQQSDGGFEQTSFAGFETTDVVLAIAEAAQTGPTWSTAEARAAIEALHAGGPGGPTPLDYLEGLIAGAADNGVPAKNIVLVAVPLGIDPTAFGSLDLVSEMGGCTGDETLGFNGLLYLTLAQQLVCGGALAANVAEIRDAQQANGGWNFAGEPSLDDIDADSTALAMQALVGGGAGPSDPAIQRGLAFFAAHQQASGAWQFFGEDDPNSTAMAMLGVAAAGYDPTISCWRDTVAPQLAGTPYARPDVWLRDQQITSGADTGRVASPSDSFGVNTLATSQSVQALLRSWLPVARADAQVCTTTGPPPSDSATTVAVAGELVTLQPRLTG